jgi:C-terminal binding protein
MNKSIVYEKMSKVNITDYVTDPYIERKILGRDLGELDRNSTEVLLVWHKNITKEVIDSLPKLKGIVRYGTGYDNIDIEYAKKKGIYVCTNPSYAVDEVSDTVIAMIINIGRSITRYDYKCRNYLDNSWQEKMIKDIKRISELKLGVVGAGRIGGSVLLKAKALKFQTYFYDPYKPQGYEKMLGANRFDELDKLLKTCDIISINTPLTNETESMINKEFLSKMKRGSSLVNTARGKIVEDIDVFYEPLKTDYLKALALDVLPDEPPKSSSKLIKAWKNREEWLDGRLIINPHVAYYSEQAYEDMSLKAALNAKRIIRNKTPYDIVNGL